MTTTTALTASTIPARTVREINGHIAMVSGLIDDCDAQAHALRNERAHADQYVVGFPALGLFMQPKGHRPGRLLTARLFDAHTAARLEVADGKGERAVVMSYEAALEQMLRQTIDAHDLLCRSFQALHVERIEAADYERHLDDCERERVLAGYRSDQCL